MPIKQPTGAAIVKQRQALGLSQLQAAKLLETSVRTYCAWERDERRMHPIIWRWFAEQVLA